MLRQNSTLLLSCPEDINQQKMSAVIKETVIHQENKQKATELTRHRWLRLGATPPETGQRGRSDTGAAQSSVLAVSGTRAAR